MRLIHTSDWHLGRTLHGESLLPHQAAFLDWLLAQAASHQVHAVLVAGDIYDRAVPSTDAVAVLDHALRGFAGAGIPVVMTSGNHDSAIRLGFGARLSELAGIHLRTSVADIARPVVLADEHGEVAIYGIPYLLPDAVMADLGAERSHASVLAAAAAQVRSDASQRDIGRTVAVAHAFITGALPCDSERDIRVGGIGDAPASVFAGLSYVALGHLHGQQDIASGDGQSAESPGADSPGAVSAGAVSPNAASQGAGSPAAGRRASQTRTTVRYSGSPLAFSFSERHHLKSVTLVEIDDVGRVSTTVIPTPVPRPLREVRGRLEDLLAGGAPAGAGAAGAGAAGVRAAGVGTTARADLAGLADAWVKVVLTDTVRPAAPMERLREKWPHTLVLDFDPEGELADYVTDLRRLAQATDPVEICGLFVEFTSGGPPDDEQRGVLADVIESARRAEAGV